VIDDVAIHGSSDDVAIGVDYDGCHVVVGVGGVDVDIIVVDGCVVVCVGGGGVVVDYGVDSVDDFFVGAWCCR